jgi:hypothetical protein
MVPAIPVTTCERRQQTFWYWTLGYALLRTLTPLESVCVHYRVVDRLLGAATRLESPRCLRKLFACLLIR